MTSRLPSYFISHGGGPWPWVPNMNAALAPLAEALARMPAEIGQRPKAVLMIRELYRHDLTATADGL